MYRLPKGVTMVSMDDDAALSRAYEQIVYDAVYGFTENTVEGFRRTLRQHGFTIVRLEPTQTKADPE